MMTAKDISSARERMGLSVPELASILGVTRQALWAWENGKKIPQSIQNHITLIDEKYSIPDNSFQICQK